MECLEEQGKVVGQTIGGNPTPFHEPMQNLSCQIFDLTCLILGETKRQEGFVEYVKGSPEDNTYRRLFVKNNQLVGGIFINDLTDKESLNRMVREKSSLTTLGSDFLGEKTEESMVRGIPQETSASANLRDPLVVHTEEETS